MFCGQLRDYATTELQKDDFDSINNIERSKVIARFFIERIFQALNPGVVPATEEELNAGVTDGSNDCNVDFVSKQAGTVAILQAKFSGHRKAASSPSRLTT